MIMKLPLEWNFTGVEPTDHSFEHGPMHVIWARGQEPGRYRHSPHSGLEATDSKVAFAILKIILRYNDGILKHMFKK